MIFAPVSIYSPNKHTTPAVMSAIVILELKNNLQIKGTSITLAPVMNAQRGEDIYFRLNASREYIPLFRQPNIKLTLIILLFNVCNFLMVNGKQHNAANRNLSNVNTHGSRWLTVSLVTGNASPQSAAKSKNIKLTFVDILSMTLSAI